MRYYVLWQLSLVRLRLSQDGRFVFWKGIDDENHFDIFSCARFGVIGLPGSFGSAIGSFSGGLGSSVGR
jgi:hypothetical protein